MSENYVTCYCEGVRVKLPADLAAEHAVRSFSTITRETFVAITTERMRRLRARYAS